MLNLHEQSKTNKIGLESKLSGHKGKIWNSLEQREDKNKGQNNPNKKGSDFFIRTREDENKGQNPNKKK